MTLLQLLWTEKSDQMILIKEEKRLRKKEALTMMSKSFDHPQLITIEAAKRFVCDKTFFSILTAKIIADKFVSSFITEMS